MKREYIIFNQRVAGELMAMGHVLKRIEKTNKDSSNRNVFVFNETPTLLEVVNNHKK